MLDVVKLAGATNARTRADSGLSTMDDQSPPESHLSHLLPKVMP
ncbi:hypothetical protein [Kibdelosporangium philippinense]